MHSSTSRAPKTGTCIAYQLPYTLIAGGVWIVFLMIWIALGIPMGPGYAPTL